MSNRRKPTRTVPLNGSPLSATDHLPFPLANIEWTEEPAADYKPEILRFIAERHREAGRLNAWTCEVCGTPFIAYDKHPGVTPFMVAHQTFDPDSECRGSCASGFYTEAAVHAAARALAYHGHPQYEPSHEWYRPNRDAFKRESAGMRQHLAQGGLALRPVAA